MNNPFDELMQRIDKHYLELQKQLASLSVVQGEAERVMSVEEAAEFLGYKKSTIYQHVHNKTIPHSKHGNKLMFLKSELIAWVKSNKVNTIEEIREEIRKGK